MPARVHRPGCDLALHRPSAGACRRAQGPPCRPRGCQPRQGDAGGTGHPPARSSGDVVGMLCHSKRLTPLKSFPVVFLLAAVLSWELWLLRGDADGYWGRGRKDGSGGASLDPHGPWHGCSSGPSLGALWLGVLGKPQGSCSPGPILPKDREEVCVPSAVTSRLPFPCLLEALPSLPSPGACRWHGWKDAQAPPAPWGILSLAL